jgi:hypothetical protein
MNRLKAVAILVALSLAGTSGAQSVTRAPASVIDRPSEAVRRSDVVPPAPIPASGQHLGEAKAEMLVGAAAIIVGALIGGDGGSVLMFGGAVVGLYGLWNYLR